MLLPYAGSVAAVDEALAAAPADALDAVLALAARRLARGRAAARRAELGALLARAPARRRAPFVADAEEARARR